jgi:hypothetical protein
MVRARELGVRPRILDRAPVRFLEGAARHSRRPLRCWSCSTSITMQLRLLGDRIVSQVRPYPDRPRTKRQPCFSQLALDGTRRNSVQRSTNGCLQIIELDERIRLASQFVGDDRWLELARSHVLDHALTQRTDSGSVARGSSILSEVDNTSISGRGSQIRQRCPLNWLPASRLLPPRSGLERSDFVHWHL